MFLGFCIMASKKTLNKENLIALGADHLADIILTVSEGNVEIKRRLRLELAAQTGSDVIATEIGKRIASLRKARSFVDWQKRHDFLKDLDIQRIMIVERVAPSRPELAFDLLWRFMDLAEPVLNRVDDSNGSVGDVFRAGCADLCTIALRAGTEPVALANKVFTVISDNGFGVFDGLTKRITPVLGEIGVAHLKQTLTEAMNRKAPKSTEKAWRSDMMRYALQEIADTEGDVDAYIRLVPIKSRGVARIEAGIARRLLSAGRTKEALEALERGRPKPSTRRSERSDDFLFYTHASDNEWEDAYIAALDATGQTNAAQELRWQTFEKKLSAVHLRDYLKKLPDFEDIEFEARAMRHVMDFDNFPAALGFLSEWPDQLRTAQLVMTRTSEIDGNMYFLLDPVAKSIEGKYPLAATILRRAMIDDTLTGAKSTRYKHAARHLAECASLAAGINDFVNHENHDGFLARLKKENARKSGFWSLLAD